LNGINDVNRTPKDLFASRRFSAIASLLVTVSSSALSRTGLPVFMPLTRRWIATSSSSGPPLIRMLSQYATWLVAVE